MKITVQAVAQAPIKKVWDAWNNPADIKQWNAASADWHTTASTVDLRVGGRMKSRMEAKDGSMGFDFEGTYTKVDAPNRLAFRMSDGRTVSVSFKPAKGGVEITETFDAETTNPIEMQRAGWQAILDSFVRHVERKAS
jgi:uncharacterized protein YndB with AHSA1/START domain